MSAYGFFAGCYDGLTENVEYPKRCAYILKAFKRLNHPMGLTLDLACGTGSLTLELAKSCVEIMGADASEDMLCKAREKADEQGLEVMFIHQKMQELQLYGNIDTCVCTLDSLNHLTSERDVLKTFQGVSRFMNRGGLFLFDVNTPYKHREILKDNVFVYETEQVFCVWQNTPLKNDAVQIDLDFFEKQANGAYVRARESFCERAYPHGTILKILEKSGFELAACYGDMTFEKPKENEQRAVYIARKM